MIKMISSIIDMIKTTILVLASIVGVILLFIVTCILGSMPYMIAALLVVVVLKTLGVM